MTKRQLFNITYRFVIPVVVLFGIVTSPEFTLCIKNNNLFGMFLLFWMSIPIWIVYPSVTSLDQTPSKAIPLLKQGLWRRFGTFRGEQFLPFYSRDQMRFFYFFNALSVSLITSFLIVWIPTFFGISVTSVRVILAFIHFILIFSPMIIYYRPFMKAMYP